MLPFRTFLRTPRLEKKITSLPVVDESGQLQGVLHLHDLWGTQML